jgi:DNA-binding ferritin-like protein
MEKGDIILKMVQIQNQFRFVHWQTTSYAKHKAYGKIYEGLDDLIDEFAEACMGKHGRPKFDNQFTLEFSDLSVFNLQEFTDGVEEFLISLDEVYDDKADSDLLNLRDEMLSLINKGKYLFTLK